MSRRSRAQRSATASTREQLYAHARSDQGTAGAGAVPVPRHQPLDRRGPQPAPPSRASTAPAAEDTSRAEAFVLDAGEPAILLGTNTGPEPGRVPPARARGVPDHVDRVRRGGARGRAHRQSSRRSPGDMDVARRARAVGRARATGSSASRVAFRVTGDAPEAKLREVVARATARSAVFDIDHQRRARSRVERRRSR